MLTHGFRLTHLRVEVRGYEPWQLALRGGAVTDKTMEGPIRLVPAKPIGPEVRGEAYWLAMRHNRNWAKQRRLE
jgi:hypothetical protein